MRNEAEGIYMCCVCRFSWAARSVLEVMHLGGGRVAYICDHCATQVMKAKRVEEKHELRKGTF